MSIRDWWRTRSPADKRGRSVRGAEALEPRTVLSAGGFPLYPAEPIQAPPPRAEPLRDMVTRDVASYAAPLSIHGRGEPPAGRFEQHHISDSMTAPWQVTIIIVPAGGVLVDRGSSPLLENSSLPHLSQVQLVGQTSYSERAESAR